MDEGSGLYRIEVSEGPGSGIRILNRPAPPAFAESALNTLSRTSMPRSGELVGDRNPREHEFSVQLRAGLRRLEERRLPRVAALLAMCSALLAKACAGAWSWSAA